MLGEAMIDRYRVSGTAVVTGASSGIGKVVAERFAGDGANVVICSRDIDHVQPVADGINDSETDGDCLAVECNVTDVNAVENLVDETIDEFGGVDVLVNNAGASFMAGFDDISPNGWRTIVDVNLTGTRNCTQIAGKHLKDGGGAVVNVASVAGQQGSPYMSHYGAAKAGVINLTRSLAFEWAGDDVRVNCIAPGFVATAGLASQMGIDADDIERNEVERRMGTTDEIADVIAFLASPAASFIVGETVTAAGVPNILESPDV